ncbi:MAG: LacI family DNA-binding transcriptional regulator [Chthoniobacteraceae bacterium]
MKPPKNTPPPKPRMRDIARQAGVSLGTVSRVMNGNTEVAPDLAERVMSAARQLGYTSPRASDGSELGTIGYVVDMDPHGTLMDEPFQQHFLCGVEQAARDCGGSVVFASCGPDLQTGALPSIVERKLVGGIILKARITTPEPWIHALHAAIPTVLLMHRTTDHAVPSVTCDNYEAMYRALMHLKALGHTRIGFLSEDERELTTPHHFERRDAFLQLQGTLGFVQNPGYLQTPVRGRGEALEDVVERGVRAFLALGQERPTAIVGAADVYALGLLKALPAHGISVPGEMSVIGVMNTAQCEFSNPPLTSISLLEEDLGRAALELLQKRMTTPRSTPEHVTMGTKLVERMSCAKNNTK